MKLIFSILAVILSIIGIIPYIKDIVKGNTQPHLYTWLIWSITEATATAGLWLGGAGIGAWSLTIGTMLELCIAFLCLKYGTKNITRSDKVILFLLLISILIWWIMGNPFVSLIMVTAIDAIGFFPTFRKTFEEPWSETVSMWGIYIIANIFSILALESYNFMTMIYLTVITIADLIIISRNLVN